MPPDVGFIETDYIHIITQNEYFRADQTLL